MDKPLALIIEDERDVAALLRHVMDMVGYRTEVILNGRVALERLTTSRPDIVLLDLNLPGVPGNKLLETIRADRRLSFTKVVVITAHSHIAEGLTAEPDLILQKPMSMDQFTVLMKRFSEKMKHQKTVPIREEPWDRVTGLYNQSFFENRLKCSIKQSEEITNHLYAVISITLDESGRFKNQLDIQRWISILQETSKILRTTVRATDTIARNTHDHFYILVENVPNKEIPWQIASRIYDKLSKHFEEHESGTRFPLRMGIILCDSHYKNVEQVLQDVNAAKLLSNLQGGIFYKDVEMPG